MRWLYIIIILLLWYTINSVELNIKWLLLPSGYLTVRHGKIHPFLRTVFTIYFDFYGPWKIHEHSPVNVITSLGNIWLWYESPMKNPSPGLHWLNRNWRYRCSNLAEPTARAPAWEDLLLGQIFRQGRNINGPKKWHHQWHNTINIYQILMYYK